MPWNEGTNDMFTISVECTSSDIISDDGKPSRLLNGPVDQVIMFPE